MSVIMSSHWYECDNKTWDRLNVSEREIFVTPNDHDDKSHLTLAARGSALIRMNIDPIRKINVFREI